MRQDERADLSESPPARAWAAILPGLARVARDDVAGLAAHEEGIGGAIMTSDNATLRPDPTARGAPEALRLHAVDPDTLHIAHVVDTEHRLLGKPNPRDILTALAPETVGAMMNGAPGGVAVDADQQVCAALIARFGPIALPLLFGSGGNAGAQSATLTVRAMATVEVRGADWGWMTGREPLVDLLLGLSMAAAISMIGVVRAVIDITLAVAVSMVLIVLTAALVGLWPPFVLSSFNLDPATASGPLVTSIADTGGVVIYFTIARTVLQG